MNFGLVLHVTEEADRKINFVDKEWTKKFDDFFKNKEYGSDIASYTIGITCVSPQFDQFFKVRKPKYIEDKIETHDGISVKIEKSYEYSIKLNFEEIMNADENEVKKILSSKIIKSLSNLDSLPKKIKDFDKERFKEDLESFFKERNLA